MPYKDDAMLIRGKRVQVKQSTEVINPATGEIVGLVGEADMGIIHQSVAAARS